MTPIDEPDFATIYNKSLDLLSRREHSVFELIQKLKKRYGPNKLINDAIIRLQESNLLDDQRFAEAYIKVRARKGFGPRRIDAELQQRKVSETIINQELSMIEDWNALALAAFKQKVFFKIEGFPLSRLNSVFKRHDIINACHQRFLQENIVPNYFRRSLGKIILLQFSKTVLL
jgi:regulatory protein